jgi:hypothetical protein
MRVIINTRINLLLEIKALEVVHITVCCTSRKFLLLLHFLLTRFKIVHVICHVKFSYLMLVGTLQKEEKPAMNLIQLRFLIKVVEKEVYLLFRMF